MEKMRVTIAAGIILNREGTEVFITRRAAKAHQGGFWEFPGGKVEQDESPATAVIRELDEEVGIKVKTVEPFLSLNHDYPDKSLSFDFFLVRDFTGEPFGREGQPGQWVKLNELGRYDFPAANGVVLEKMERELGENEQ
ncbi:8-oxo-dGTP diphosphatase MutT [Parasalinivibrio latis]|uniref:8-oxo-dGTP diphosphatase MutT n=1 Tax=Parasalinivibrio latis TaxID=2952610 RepID=UPI0030E3C3FF